MRKSRVNCFHLNFAFKNPPLVINFSRHNISVFFQPSLLRCENIIVTMVFKFVRQEGSVKMLKKLYIHPNLSRGWVCFTTKPWFSITHSPSGVASVRAELKIEKGERYAQRPKHDCYWSKLCKSSQLIQL